MKAINNRRFGLICTILGIGFFLLVTIKFSTNLKREVVISGSIDITCGPEDRRDTQYIRSQKQIDDIIIPDSDKLETLSREELAYLYHRYIENIQYLCKHKVRLGSIEDGGWDICDEARFRPQRNDSGCLVYSFGINNDFTFDEAVSEYYECDVHSFDPSMNMDDFNKDKIHFHNLGISSRDELTKDGWRLMRYNSIRSQLGHAKAVISILKMDIELYEWSVLPDILSTADLTGTYNIVMEFHLQLHSAEQNRSQYLIATKILRQLYVAGYRIFWSRQNKWCQFTSKCKQELRTNCHEVSLVKIT